MRASEKGEGNGGLMVFLTILAIIIAVVGTAAPASPRAEYLTMPWFSARSVETTGDSGAPQISVALSPLETGAEIYSRPPKKDTYGKVPYSIFSNISPMRSSMS